MNNLDRLLLRHIASEASWPSRNRADVNILDRLLLKHIASEATRSGKIRAQVNNLNRLLLRHITAEASRPGMRRAGQARGELVWQAVSRSGKRQIGLAEASSNFYILHNFVVYCFVP